MTDVSTVTKILLELNVSLNKHFAAELLNGPLIFLSII